MTGALSIKRKKGGADELGFEQLRRDGIGHAQQFSGKLWSDYNLHDPGVTILEQLCYGLTDLIHRAGLDVADYLADTDGSLDFDRLALYRPEQIFPARPTTIGDYREALLAAVPELENIWFKSVAQQGRYQVVLKLAHGVGEEAHDGVISKVRSHYNTMRNLCEEIATITIVKDDDYQLCAEIECGTGRPAAEILAEIYFECAHAIDRCRNGDGNHGDGGFSVTSLFAIINAVEGVDQIATLSLEKSGKHYYDSVSCSDPGMALNLAIPDRGGEIQVKLLSNGRLLPVSINELRAKYDELEFVYHSSRRSRALQQYGAPLPRGIFRELADYYSIQNQFPVNYGIGVHGVPSSAPEEVKARAHQLKSYLLIFEQLMANYLANLDSIRQLFSMDMGESTYSTQTLDGSVVPGIEQLIPSDAGEAIAEIMASFDNATERKSRLLDYMLALYGERFPQHSLRHFNYYTDQQQMEEAIVANKLAYLESVVELGRDRAAAGDLSAPLNSPQSLSGLQRRAALLLGFRERSESSLTMALLRHDLHLMPHDLYERHLPDGEGLPLIETAALDTQMRESLMRVPELAAEETVTSNSRARELIGEKIPLKQNPLSDLLLRHGIHLDRYRIATLAVSDQCQLLFRVDESRLWNLGTFANVSETIQAAHALRQFLRHLNAESEGIYLIEHTLLRPRLKSTQTPAPKGYYPFRISVIFPAWSARCHDPQFRMLAEETVILNTPAHIHPEFYWLDFHEIHEFEMLHEKWLTLRQEATSSAEAIDGAAVPLVRFLLARRNGVGGYRG